MMFWTTKTSKKRPQARKPIFLGQESEKSEIRIPNSENFEKYIKDAPKKTVQNGSYTSPNELTRSQMKQNRFGVKCKNTVKMQS